MFDLLQDLLVSFGPRTPAGDTVHQLGNKANHLVPDDGLHVLPGHIGQTYWTIATCVPLLALLEHGSHIGILPHPRDSLVLEQWGLDLCQRTVKDA